MADIAQQPTSGNKEIISRKAMVSPNFNATYDSPFTRNALNSTLPLKKEDDKKSHRSHASSQVRRLTNKALTQLGSLGSLHETDIFKICTKTMQRSQIAQILTPQGIKGAGGLADIDQEQL
jgi:hypothetical protein